MSESAHTLIDKKSLQILVSASDVEVITLDAAKAYCVKHLGLVAVGTDATTKQKVGYGATVDATSFADDQADVDWLKPGESIDVPRGTQKLYMQANTTATLAVVRERPWVDGPGSMER